MIEDQTVPATRRAGHLVSSYQYNPNNCWADRLYQWAAEPHQCRNPDPGDDLGLCAECKELLLP